MDIAINIALFIVSAILVVLRLSKKLDVQLFDKGFYIAIIGASLLFFYEISHAKPELLSWTSVLLMWTGLLIVGYSVFSSNRSN